MVIGLLVLTAQPVWSQAKDPDAETPLTRILFIFDASNSMNGRWESGVKIDIARKLLSSALDSLVSADNLQVALRVYGHQKYYLKGQDCDDTKLEVPFADGNSGKIKSKLRKIVPKGTTPIARTLEKSAEDFPECDNCRNIIILITDGLEECNGDPCAMSLALQAKGIVLKPFVIGIGLDLEFRKTFECIGTYFDASNEATFKQILDVVISQALNSTTAQANLLDIHGQPTETDVNMTFYDGFTGKIHYNLIHTMNHKGNPDTLTMDPVNTYKMVVHTIPSVTLDSITLVAGKHNIFGVDAPQGIMQIRILGLNDKDKMPAIVRQDGKMQTLNIQDVGDKEKYLVGKYDLEVLTLPRTYIEDVEIAQNHTTTVDIPLPGLITIIKPSKGYGSLYLENDGKLTWVTNLQDDLIKETYSLQPGNYRVVFRPKGARETIFTSDKSFKISSGVSEVVKLF